MTTRQSGNGSMGRKKVAPPSRSIRIEEDIYDDALIIAAHKKTYPSTIINDILRPIIKEMKLEVFKKSLKEMESQEPEVG